MLRVLLVFLAFVATGCTGMAPRAELVTPQRFDVTFQEGQLARIKLMGRNADLEQAFAGWVEQGVYNQTPVYRQVPGVFLLTGKPRLAGAGFVAGAEVAQDAKALNAKAGTVGLVVHADGTVGPELVLMYGRTLRGCCDEPQNVRIGVIEQSHGLKEVLRGDNVLGVVKAP